MIPMNAFVREPESLIHDQIKSVERVIRSGWWILGKEVASFEKNWAAYTGASYAVGVGNGMDALEIGLRACGVGEGDEVITTPVTAFATVLAIMRTGATPVLADIEPDTAILSVESVRRCISSRTKGVMVVHLYGRAAPLREYEELCNAYSLQLFEDCAQAHGARSEGRPVGTAGRFAGWSFYPTKNLGAVGDGGALTTNDKEIAETAEKLRNYGQSVRYHHPMVGMNSRLDELQAAMLNERLKRLDEWIKQRRHIAKEYSRRITNGCVDILPLPADEASHVHHLFVILSRRRDRLIEYLRKNGIETLIHYPVPVHHQQPCRRIRIDPRGLPAAEKHAQECLSLPCNPFLTNAEIDYIINTINGFSEK